jgi:hypothetical protein
VEGEKAKGKVAESELARRRTPLDFVEWNPGNSPHGAFMDLAKVIEKRLHVANLHANHRTALA